MPTINGQVSKEMVRKRIFITHCHSYCKVSSFYFLKENYKTRDLHKHSQWAVDGRNLKVLERDILGSWYPTTSLLFNMLQFAVWSCWFAWGLVKYQVQTKLI